MSKTKTIKINTDVTPQITRACEICGGYTDKIENHICGYCRHALALMIRDWEHNRRGTNE